MKENENLPAFPHVVYNQNDGHWDGRYEIYKQEGGMTLRDYFAAKAMAQLIAHKERLMSDAEYSAADAEWAVANAAYLQADAMLAARKKQP